MNSLYKFIVACIALLVITTSAYAEGTKEIMKKSTSKGKIIIHKTISKFAYANAPADYRLNIRINEIGEVINIGFGNVSAGQDPPNYIDWNHYLYGEFFRDIECRIIAPDGQVLQFQDEYGNIFTWINIYDYFSTDMGHISNYNQAIAGPNTINSSGYEPFSFKADQIGDYYIEFITFNDYKKEFIYFDITVADAATNKKALPGRLWSKAWCFSTSISSPGDGFDNPFDGKVFIYSEDSVVTSVDFNSIKPLVFTVAANETGCDKTGDFEKDRKSRKDINAKYTYPQYKIFLNDPDSNAFPSGSLGTISVPTELTGCPPTEFCIDVTVNKPGDGEVLIDLNGISGYQQNTKDVLKIVSFKQGKNCVSWDGLDAFGNQVPSGTMIKIDVKYINGLTHLPLNDIESNTKGIKVKLIRPMTANPYPKLYWDDLNLSGGTLELNGCADTNGCHKWIGSGSSGIGNESTINTWWYASDNVKDSLIINFIYITVDAGKDTLICGSEKTIQLKGKVENATGGKWSGGSGTFSNDTLMTATYTFSNADKTAGSVKLYLTSTGNGTCPAQKDSIIITIDKEVTANAGADKTICATPTTLTASGGSKYTWNTTPAQYTASISVSPTAKTTYIVTVSNVACSGIDTVVISLGNIEANAGNDVTICTGGKTTLKATGGVTYSWSNGKTTDTTSVSPTTTTTYYVTAYDGTCTDKDTVVVYVLSSITANAGLDKTICLGEKITLKATGGTTYSWSNGKTTDTTTVSPTVKTTYTVTVNSGGCTASDNVVISINPIPTANAGADQMICAGTKITLKATGGTTYIWSNGKTTDTTSVSPTVKTTYTVTGTTSGCTASDNVVITVNPIPTIKAGLDKTICLGEKITLKATGGTTYSWSNGKTTDTTTVSPTVKTTYTVTGTTSGCSASDNVVIIVNAVPTINAGANKTICSGEKITLKATGGTTYSWSNGKITDTTTIAPMFNTTYTVTGTTSGCSASDNVIITVNPIPTANAGLDKTICSGEKITLKATGGTTYSWNNAKSTDTSSVSPTVKTTYTVTVNSSGCTASDNVVITVNPIPIADAGADQTIYKGDTTTITASGGGTYNWINGSTGDSISVNPSTTTTYTVTVTKLGCTASDYVIITVETLNASVNAGNDVTICKGDTTTLTATGVDSYIWNTGQTDANINVNPSITTTYIVTGTKQGVTSIDSVIVIVKPLPIANAGANQTVCNGYPTSLKATGGTKYKWSNGKTTDTTTVYPTIKTTYTVTVETNGCTAKDNVVITVKPLPNANAGLDETICNGEKITLQASGGNQYSWSNGKTTDTTTVYPTLKTTYTVTVGINGCTATDQVVISVNPIPTADAGANKTICLGDKTTLKATGGGNYLWSNGKTTDTTTVAPTKNTTYRVTVTLNGCTASDNVVITVNTIPIANAGNDVTICKGESTTLKATGGYTYKWSTGATDSTIVVNPTNTTAYYLTAYNGICTDEDTVVVKVINFNPPNAGADKTICKGETVTITANAGYDTYLWSNGKNTQSIDVKPNSTTTYKLTTTIGICSGTDEVVITVKPLPSVDAGINQTICKGSSTTIKATATAGSTLLWSNGSSNDSILITPNITTKYTVTANLNACTAKDSVMVNVAPIPIADAGADKTICDDVTDDVIITAFNDPNIVSYKWDNGLNTNPIAVLPTLTTTYTLTVYSAFCSATDQVSVIVHKTPKVNLGNDIAICFGESITITDTSTAETYLWSNGNTSNSITVSPPFSTNYSITATNKGCTASDNIVVTVKDIPENMINKQYYVCEGDSFKLNLDTKYQYIWNGTDTSNIFSIKAVSSNTYTLISKTNLDCERLDTFEIIVKKLPINTLADTINTCKNIDLILTATGGNYYKWETNETTQSIIIKPAFNKLWKLTVGLNGCFINDSVFVQTFDIPTISANKYYTICNGENVNLKVNSANAMFNWSNGMTGDSIVVSPNTTTTYTVTATNNGCTAKTDIIVTVNSNPIVNLGQDKTICENDTISIVATGGTSYSWNTTSTDKMITISPNVNTTYNVTVTNANNCSASDEIVVFVQPKFYFNFPKDTTICYGNEIIVNLQGADSYLWNDGSKQAIVKLAPLNDTKYYITATKDACYDIGEFNIKVLEQINITSTIKHVSCYGENSGSIEVIATGGDANYNYIWSNGAVGDKLENLISGTYTLTVIDGIGCTATKLFTIEQPEKLNISGTVKNITCYGQNDGAIKIMIDGGIKPYSYSWNNNQTGSFIESLSKGTYSLTVKDSNNCEVYASYNIIEPNELISTFDIQDATCHGICNGNINTTTTGGISPYKYRWSDNNDTTANRYSVCAGNYTISVYDNNACYKKYDLSINELSVITFDITTENLKCYNDKKGTIKVIASGGAPDYKYLWEDGNTSNEREELAAGTYKFTVYDAKGCQKDSFAIITEPDNLNLTFTNMIQPACFNDCNGALKVNVSGGTSPYQYIWSNNTNNDNINKLCAGTYSVTIKDANNCFAATYFILNNPAPLSITMSSVNTHCIGDCNGSATASLLGGTAPYNFKWSNGDENPTAVNLCQDTYKVTATDSRNCSISASVTVNTNSSIPNVSITADKDTIISGSFTNLHLIESNLYNYSWVADNDLNQTDIFSPMVTPTQSKYFYALITDQYNCTFLDSILINVKQPVCDEPYIFIPNAFTPNGDKQNDVLYLRGLNIKDFHLSIFDRWGEKVFETYDMSIGWDGTYKGRELPPAVYTYYLELTCPDGYQLFKKGNVTLIR